jgi:hypothetical protein
VSELLRAVRVVGGVRGSRSGVGEEEGRSAPLSTQLYHCDLLVPEGFSQQLPAGGHILVGFLIAYQFGHGHNALSL